MTHDMRHMNFLRHVTEQDIECLITKERTYQGSWKQRGGVGAFMNVARKWDRLEIMMAEGKYNIFEGMLRDTSGADGTVLAEVRDLRRYLLLIEAEIEARSHAGKKAIEEAFTPGTPDDGGHHEQQVNGGMKPPAPARLADRLDDGYEGPLPRDQHEFYFSVPSNGKSYQLVNRSKVPQELWAHLPRLDRELNNTEYNEAMPCYKGLYRWNGSESKWVLQPQYVEHYGEV